MFLAATIGVETGENGLRTDEESRLEASKTISLKCRKPGQTFQKRTDQSLGFVHQVLWKF